MSGKRRSFSLGSERRLAASASVTQGYREMCDSGKPGGESAAPGPEAPAAPPAAAPASFQWTRMIFALFGVPFVIAGLIPIGIGIMIFLPNLIKKRVRPAE